MKIEIFKSRQKGEASCDMDAEEFTRAVQDLGMEVIDAGLVKEGECEARDKRCSKYTLTAATKKALCSIFHRREKQTKIIRPNVKISLDDFPQVPDHPISA